MTTAYDTSSQPPAPFIEFDVLNHFILTLNGKDLLFELQDP